jgi:hypothetical protein
MNLCLNQNKHNMKKIIYTLAFIFSLTGSAIAQWTDLKAPQVPSNGLPGQNSGHDYGLLAISKDGKNIAAYSSKTVWSPGYANTKHFIVSKDFGATWTENAGPSMNPIQFFWEGDELFLEESLSKILKKSTDFGATFTNQNENLFSIGLSEKILQVAADNWIMIQSNRVMQSADKGLTWTDKGAANISAGANLFSTTKAANGNLISTGVKGAAYSSDNGLTWTASVLPTTLPNSGDNTVSTAANGDILLFVFPSKLIFKSTDNGVNFSAVTSNLPMTAGNCKYVNNDIICVGTDAATYKSTDGGTSFTKMTEPNALFTANIMGTKLLEKNGNNLFTGGVNKLYKYGSSASATYELVKSNLDFKVYPNPAKELVQTEGIEVTEKTTIAVYSIDGALILEQRNGSNKIDVSGFEAGIYLMKLTDESGKVGVSKFVKE